MALTPQQRDLATRFAQINLGVALASVSPVTGVTQLAPPPVDSVLIIRSNQTPGYAAVEVKADDLISVTEALDLLAGYTVVSFTHDQIAVVEDISHRDSQAIAEGLGWTRFNTSRGAETYSAWIPGQYSKLRFLVANQLIRTKVQLQWWSFNTSTETPAVLDISIDTKTVTSPRKSLVIITPSDYSFLPQDAGVVNYVLLGVTPDNYNAVLAALALIAQYSSIIRWDQSGLILARPDLGFSSRGGVSRDFSVSRDTDSQAITRTIADQLGYTITSLDNFTFGVDEADGYIQGSGFSDDLDLVSMANNGQITLLTPGAKAVKVLGPEPTLNGPIALIWATLPVQGRLGNLIR